MWFIIQFLLKKGPFEFNIYSQGSEYTFLEKITLCGKTKIMKEGANGTLEDAKDGDDYSGEIWITNCDLKSSNPIFHFVLVCNNFGNSLFRSVECQINGCEVVDQSSASYPHKCYIENLLSQGPNSQNTFLESSLFYKEVPGTEERFTKTGGTNLNDSGYAKRQEIVKNSNIIEFECDTCIDFFKVRNS